ncbi:MAG: AraC family transcriptional regulator, partial [Acinetobacter sp.]|nr:AraC family transcriptional regulator [Acinetobacter sp.]
MKEIAIIVYDGCWAMSVMMLKDFFHVVNLLSIRQGQAESYQVEMLSLDGLAKTSASSPSIEVDDKVRMETTYDLVILPSFEGNRLDQIQQENDDLVDWLTSQIQQQTP